VGEAGPQIYVLTAALSTLGEGAIWDVDEQRLYWIDVFEGTIFRCTAEGGEIRVWKFPKHLTSLALRSGGGAIITSGRRLHLFDFETGDIDAVIDVDTGSASGFNDGKVDRQGRFVTGTVNSELMGDNAPDPSEGFEPGGHLFRVDPDLAVHPIADGIGLTNGPCFSPDGATLYCNDSWARRIYSYDYDTATGAATNRRTLATVDGPLVQPDGATVDEQGYIWVAVFCGGEIRRYAPDGTLDRRVAVPVGSPVSVTFGGADLDTLFVTSIGNADLPGHVTPAGPLAGSILAVRGLGVRGVPEIRFAG
jgi:sugar lactone lactonase YvrE